MKIVSHSTPAPDDQPAPKKELRVEPPAPAPGPVASPVIPAAAPIELRDAKPVVPAETKPSDVEVLSGRFEMELKKQIAAMHRALTQDIEELHQHQQKLEEKEDRHVQTTLDHIQDNYAAEWKAAEQKWEVERARWTEQLKQREVTIEKLSREMSALKKAVENPPVASTPAPVVVPPVAPSTPMTTPVAVIIPSLPPAVPASVPEKPAAAPLILDEFKPASRKIGFLTRAWNYLNGTAIEIPIKSRNKE